MNAPLLPIEISTILIELRPLAPYLADPGINEIKVNRPGQVLLERPGSKQAIDLPELTYEALEALVNALANATEQVITPERPIMDATLPGGQRVHVVMPPAVSLGTISLTIRQHETRDRTLSDLVEEGAFDNTRCVQSLLLPAPERAEIERQLTSHDRELLSLFHAHDWLKFWPLAVARRKNIVASGAPSAGKTTLGKALAGLIPAHERIITIEDVAEMRMPQDDQVNLFYTRGGNGTSKVTVNDHLEGVLRMRPDRVLLSELRGGEAFYFIQHVVNTGTPGTITTLHASRAMLAFHRLALMIKGTVEGGGLELRDIKETLYGLIDVVAQMEHLPDGRRVVAEVYFDPAHAARQLG
jgi:type IV secretion system protein VirB11